MTGRKKNIQPFNTKRCPECSAELQLDVTRCHSCGKRVGDIDHQGRAKRPFDWYAYGACFLSWLAFFLYIWWAFLKE